jgi:hypothetical protein
MARSQYTGGTLSLRLANMETCGHLLLARAAAAPGCRPGRPPRPQSLSSFGAMQGILKAGHGILTSHRDDDSDNLLHLTRKSARPALALRLQLPH